MKKWIDTNIKIMNKLSLIERQILDVKSNRKDFDRDIIESDAGYDILNKIPSDQAIKQNKIEEELEQLETKRQHILDRRNGWLSKLFFSVITPVVVTVFTAYTLNVFGLLK